ncbi:MAG: arsenate reductase ArsC [Deltaproteobacteria bacterium]|nr:arsenate reductase ArsC [Deltaproteobacteria bacterium]
MESKKTHIDFTLANASSKLLFVCVENSARSQMAEGIARRLAPESVSVFSAGSQPSGSVHPLAVEVMAEIGIDISSQTSKGLDAVPLEDIDIAVTLCAEESCPVISTQAQKYHLALEDPAGNHQNETTVFRAVRDRLYETIQTWFEPSA